MKRILGLILALLLPAVLSAQDSALPSELEGVKFDQRLGEQVPLGLSFRDDLGRAVRLQQYFGEKPVLLILAYNRCPRLCSVVLREMVDSVRQLTLEPGKDFTIVVVSIDAREGPALSRPMKRSCLDAYGRGGTDDGWHFLTGEENEIRQLADAVGFQFVYDVDKDLFRHPSGIMILTPGGKVSHYFFGIKYAPQNLRLGLVEASENRISAPVDRVLLFACFAYDADSGKYLISPMKLMRMGAMLTMLILGGYLAKNWFTRDKPATPLLEPGVK